MNLFDWDKPSLKIRKPIRLIELFAGIGAQAIVVNCLVAILGEMIEGKETEYEQ